MDVELRKYQPAILIVGFWAAHSCYNGVVVGAVFMTISEIHAPSLIECRVWTAIAFYSSCPHLSTFVRALIATIGLCCPLFPPDKQHDTKETDTHMSPKHAGSAYDLQAIHDGRLLAQGRPCKMQNEGNSCFINASLQAIVAAREIQNRLYYK